MDAYFLFLWAVCGTSVAALVVAGAIALIIVTFRAALGKRIIKQREEW